MQDDPFKSLMDMAGMNFQQVYDAEQAPVAEELKQKNGSWCGPAALSYALAQQDLSVPQDILANLAKTTMKDGTDNKNMIREARRFGFNVKIYNGGDPNETIAKMDQDLLDGSSIIIDYLDGDDIGEDGHYIVYQGSTGDKVIFWDPWKGRNVVLPRDKFIKKWIDETMDGKGILLHWAMVLSKPI